ncbi:MAG: hypothetical protein ACE5EH_07270 [Gammaproteobacteria bacterium]
MNKKLIALAVAGAFAGAASVANAEGSASVNGFVDVELMLQNDHSPTSEKAFSANGEVDFTATSGSVTTRVDVDVMAGGASMEQGLFSWGVNDAVTVIGGIFNNPIGADSVDKPDMNFATHSVVYNILDQQTTISDNSIAGLAFAGAAGPVSVTVGLLNDIGGVAEENSIALVLGGSPVDNLNVEFGYVTQDSSAENVWDINGTYTMDAFTVGADILGADAIVDMAYSIWGGFHAGMFDIKLRYDSLAWEASGMEDVTATTFHVGFEAAENLEIALEVVSADNAQSSGANQTLADAVSGFHDENETLLEIIGTF